jgi:hypothetical protein
MCTAPLPPGVYPIAVDKYIISYSYHIIFCNYCPCWALRSHNVTAYAPFETYFLGKAKTALMIEE